MAVKAGPRFQAEPAGGKSSNRGYCAAFSACGCEATGLRSRAAGLGRLHPARAEEPMRGASGDPAGRLRVVGCGAAISLSRMTSATGSAALVPSWGRGCGPLRRPPDAVRSDAAAAGRAGPFFRRAALLRAARRRCRRRPCRGRYAHDGNADGTALPDPQFEGGAEG